MTEVTHSPKTRTRSTVTWKIPHTLSIREAYFRKWTYPSVLSVATSNAPPPTSTACTGHDGLQRPRPSENHCVSHSGFLRKPLAQATEHLASRVVWRSKTGNEWITTKQVRLATFSYFPITDGLRNFSLRKGGIPNAPIIIGRERDFQTRPLTPTPRVCSLNPDVRGSCLPGTHQVTPPAGKGGQFSKFCGWASELAHHRGGDVPFLGSSLWSRNQNTLVFTPFLCNDCLAYGLLCSSSHWHLFTVPKYSDNNKVDCCYSHRLRRTYWTSDSSIRCLMYVPSGCSWRTALACPCCKGRRQADLSHLLQAARPAKSENRGWTQVYLMRPRISRKMWKLPPERTLLWW